VNAKEAPVKYLRLTIDVSVYNDEVVVALEKLEMSNLDLVRNIEAGEIEIDGYSDVEVH
jgi:hypothetical protein